MAAEAAEAAVAAVAAEAAEAAAECREIRWVAARPPRRTLTHQTAAGIRCRFRRGPGARHPIRPRGSGPRKFLVWSPRRLLSCRLPANIRLIDLQSGAFGKTDQSGRALGYQGKAVKSRA